MSKGRCGAGAQANETGGEDGDRPPLHEEWLPEDGDEVCRDQEPLTEVPEPLQSALNWITSACLRAWPSGLDDLPEGRPAPALSHHHPSYRTPIWHRIKSWHRRKLPSDPV